MPPHLKNNPLFALGESGRGQDGDSRSAWPCKIIKGEVPHVLKDAIIYQLDMGTLLAGTRYRGDFLKNASRR